MAGCDLYGVVAVGFGPCGSGMEPAQELGYAEKFIRKMIPCRVMEIFTDGVEFTAINGTEGFNLVPNAFIVMLE
jgi:hypothetical protein